MLAWLDSVFMEGDYRDQVTEMTVCVGLTGTDQVWECCRPVKYMDDVIIRSSVSKQTLGSVTPSLAPAQSWKTDGVLFMFRSVLEWQGELYNWQLEIFIVSQSIIGSLSISLSGSCGVSCGLRGCGASTCKNQKKNFDYFLSSSPGSLSNRYKSR